jgi:hypothetical protein
MKRAFIYGTKVWLTAFGIPYVGMLAIIFFGPSKPVGHFHEGLDPFSVTIVFAMLSICLLPSWLIFCICVNSITKRVHDIRKQKTMLTVRAGLALLANFSPVLLGHVSDETYYPLLGLYVVITGIAVWIYKPPLLNGTPQMEPNLNSEL